MCPPIVKIDQAVIVSLENGQHHFQDLHPPVSLNMYCGMTASYVIINPFLNSYFKHIGQSVQNCNRSSKRVTKGK